MPARKIAGGYPPFQTAHQIQSGAATSRPALSSTSPSSRRRDSTTGTATRRLRSGEFVVYVGVRRSGRGDVVALSHERPAPLAEPGRKLAVAQQAAQRFGERIRVRGLDQKRLGTVVHQA